MKGKEQIIGKIMRATKKAFLVRVDMGHRFGSRLGWTEDIWFPRSQVEVEDAQTETGYRYIHVPFWLTKARGLR